MQHFNKKTTLSLYAAPVLMLGIAQGVHAHAGFREQIAESGSTNSNAVTITHGCNTNKGGEGGGAPHKDVIAFSAVFPDFTNVANVIIRNSAGTVPAQSADGVVTPAGTGTVGDEKVMPDLSNDIVGSTATVAMTAGLTTVMAGGTIFANNIPIVDAKGNVRGWQSWSGPKPFNGPVLLESAKKPDGSDISTTGFAPFRIGSIQFKSTSCAKTLRIRVAVANWCGRGRASLADPGANADIWIGSLTGKFNDPDTMPNASKANGGSGAIFWPTLTVNRNLTSNPLPADCAGKYDTVYIEPTQSDIDALLPISKEKYPLGAGDVYWPTN